MANSPIDPQKLSAAILAGIDKSAKYEDERATRMGRGFENLTRPVGGAFASFVPGAWVQAAIEAADRAAGLTILKRTLRHDVDDLDACETAALSIQAWAAGTNAASGGLAGWFGAAGATADVPATLALAARNVRATGVAFGFEGNSAEEKAFRLKVLELSTRQAGESRKETINKIREMAGVLNQPEFRYLVDHSAEWAIEKIVERVARHLGVSLSSRKIGQMVPIVGGVVGATVNASFQTDVSRAARYSYRTRWLMTRKLLPAPDGFENNV